MESIMSDEQMDISKEELLTAREERRLELQQRFNPDKMKIVRKELFANPGTLRLRSVMETLPLIPPASTDWKMWSGSIC
jgi:hypothetical protein